MHRAALALLCAVLVLQASWSHAASKPDSYKEIASFSFGSAMGQLRDLQLLLIDVSGSIAGSDPKSAGESVASGDWSIAIDARGWGVASLLVNEYGSGSISVSLWDCRISGAVAVIAGVDLPGVEDPASAPSAADPDPLCTRVASGVDGIGVASDGDSFEITARTFHFLIARVDTCTGNCDAQIGLQLTR